ncbi:unnamed protein product [Amoebophrya sp. A120]|nr:unnamed protein product [Amoebophrya sp. A120]|eukprot:GSA120T00005324001.1
MWAPTGLRPSAFASIDPLQVKDDPEAPGRFVRTLVTSEKVFAVPGESFYARIPQNSWCY